MFCPGYKRKERYWVLCQETAQNVLLAWGRSAGLGCAGCGDEGAPRTHRLHCGHFRLLVLALCSPEPLTETPQGLVKCAAGVGCAPCRCHLGVQSSSWQIFQVQMWAAQRAGVAGSSEAAGLCFPRDPATLGQCVLGGLSDKVALTRGVTWSRSCTGDLLGPVPAGCPCPSQRRGLGEGTDGRMTLAGAECLLQDSAPWPVHQGSF